MDWPHVSKHLQCMSVLKTRMIFLITPFLSLLIA